MHQAGVTGEGKEQRKKKKGAKEEEEGRMHQPHHNLLSLQGWRHPRCHVSTPKAMSMEKIPRGSTDLDHMLHSLARLHPPQNNCHSLCKAHHGS